MKLINNEYGAENPEDAKSCGLSFDSASKPSVSIQKPYASCQVGDIFTYGSYPQGKNGEVDSIKWRVLARESDRLLVIAEYGLDAKRYNKEWEYTTWSQCTLRTWLNGEFLNKAFTAEEQRSLMRVTLSNPDSPWSINVSGGPDTEDKVFLLSFDEVEQYFSSDDERCCKATAYAVEQGAMVMSKGYAEDIIVKNRWDMTEDEVEAIYDKVARDVGNCVWWLRTPGWYACDAAYIYFNGDYDYGSVNNDKHTVRPAACLALRS